MTGKWWIGKGLEGGFFLALSRCYPNIFLEGMRKSFYRVAKEFRLTATWKENY